MVADPAAARRDLDAFQRDFALLHGALCSRLRGLDDLLERVLLAALIGGHVLLEGPPGLGKTLLARSLAESLGLPWRRIQLTPDLLPTDLIGTEVLHVDPATGARSLRFRPGPLHTHLVLADEINRAPPRTQSALLEAMAEGQVSVGDTTLPLPRPFLVIATQNPIELEGTFPLPEAQLDRFCIRLLFPYPSPTILEENVRDGLQGPDDPAPLAPPLLVPGLHETFYRARAARTGGDEDSRRQAESRVADAVLPRLREMARTLHGGLETGAAVRLITRTLLDLQPAHGPSAPPTQRLIRLGPSPRAGQLWLRLAAARAARRGQPVIGADDVLALALDVLGHRVLLHPGEDPAEGPRLIAASLSAAGAAR